MSAKKITVKMWECRCELSDCPSKGEPWMSRGEYPPKRCSTCKRLTWNRPDQRIREDKMTEEELREYNRVKQAESRARRAKGKAHDRNSDDRGKTPNVQ